MAKSTSKSSERGSAVVEFLLASLIWIPLLMGTAIFGYNLMRAIQVSQFCRDAGHMFAYGIDFTTTQNQALLGQIAKPLGITATSGNGAIVLSKVTMVTASDCSQAGASASCPNKGLYVFTYFLTYGNPLYAKTKLGATVPDTYISGSKAITFNDYVTNTDLRASYFAASLRFADETQAGQVTYVSEVSLASQFLNYNGFSGTGSYARSFF